MGNVAQTLGSASVTTSLPSTVGTVYSLVEPKPAGFSINSSTGVLSFAGGIAGYGNMNTSPDTIKIKASLNSDDEKDVNIWRGLEPSDTVQSNYEVDMSINKGNWNVTPVVYYYLEEKNSVLAMTVGAQNVQPSTTGLKTRTLCSTIYNNEGRAATINGVTRGTGQNELETRVSSIPVVGERTITLSGGPRPVSETSDSVFSYDMTNKNSYTDFSLNIIDDNQFTLSYDRNTERSEFNIGSIDQTTGRVSSESTLGLALTTIGQSTEYIGRGTWNPYINIPDTATGFRQSVDPGEIYTMFSDSFGTVVRRIGTITPYNESARMNFNYGWTWGMGNFMPATYLPPFKSRIFEYLLRTKW